MSKTRKQIIKEMQNKNARKLDTYASWNVTMGVNK